MNRTLCAALIATAAAAGCTDDNDAPQIDETVGAINVVVAGSPAAVAAIHVAVTAGDIVGSVDADLVKQVDDSWLGTVLDVPPGTQRTITGEGFDAMTASIYEGMASNVTVFAGQLTNVNLTLTPTQPGHNGANTPPHFLSLVYPQSILSSQTAGMAATAADPDANALLTYTWSVLMGGGSVSNTVIANQVPSTPVSSVYTPDAGYTGFALIQVEASDGLATTTTTFPIAVGAGIVPRISFETPPDTTVYGVERQSLMPRGTSAIQYAFTNPNQSWTPATMQFHTAWSDSCGGSFDAAPEDISLNKGDTASRTVVYTASATAPASPERCELTMTVTTASGVTAYSTVNVWIDPPMVMWQSSAAVPGNAFNGSWQAADAFCQSLADAPTSATPPGIYRALLSFDEISAKNRLLDAPFTRIDGTPIARDKAELYSINLQNAIRTNENNSFTGVSALFTGTNGDGSKGTNCLNWSSTDGDETSTAGINATFVNPNWTNSGTFTCSAQLPIYCVQQPQ